MKIKHLRIFIAILFVLVTTPRVFAATDNGVCISSAQALQQGQTTVNGTATKSGNGWNLTPTPLATIVAFSLVDCRNIFPANVASLKTSYYSLNNSQIDFNQPLNVGGNVYYKIINTSNSFVNNYGYIYFRVQDTKTGSSAQPLAQKVDFWTGLNGLGESVTQGVNILDLQVYFTRAPTKVISMSNLKIGSVYLGVSVIPVPPATRTNANDQQSAYISFNVNPELTKTCSLVDPNVVTLPTMPTSSLKQSGDEVGRTDFSVTANCDSGLANTPLFGVMVDNNSLSNNTDILTNTNSSSNVALRIYDKALATSIKYNNEFNFGTLDNSSQPKSTKVFYIQYYKRNSNATTAGTVNGQVTISVFYK